MEKLPSPVIHKGRKDFKLKGKGRPTFIPGLCEVIILVVSTLTAQLSRKFDTQLVYPTVIGFLAYIICREVFSVQLISVRSRDTYVYAT
jgi:hypothetical protein